MICNGRRWQGCTLMRALVIVAHAKTCGSFSCWVHTVEHAVIGTTSKASAPGSGSPPWVNKKRRRKPCPVVLGKSREKRQNSPPQRVERK